MKKTAQVFHMEKRKLKLEHLFMPQNKTLKSVLVFFYFFHQKMKVTLALGAKLKDNVVETVHWPN